MTKTELDLMRDAYAALLRLPLASVARIRSQNALCALRDGIATATNTDARIVQERAEDEALAYHLSR